jgi:hypothetical protein
MEEANKFGKLTEDKVLLDSLLSNRYCYFVNFYAR